MTPAGVPRRRHLLAALALAAAGGGCALLTPPQTRALAQAAPAGLPARVELARVPFFAQTAYHCGPAALATVLGAVGVDAPPETLADQVYLPARQGSLQVEMLATARRQGLSAVRLPPTLDALLREVAAGHAVVVLQNLALSFAPRWHYAVIFGYDLDAGELLLRSGTTARLHLPLSTFEHTWARAGHWAFVALPPARLPVSASETEVTAAAVAFERVAPAAAAQIHYDAALARWPDNLTLAIGAGNTRAARGDLDAAAKLFERAAEGHDSAAAWVNLAEVRRRQGRRQQALEAAERAIAASARDPTWADAALSMHKRLGAR